VNSIILLLLTNYLPSLLPELSVEIEICTMKFFILHTVTSTAAVLGFTLSVPTTTRTTRGRSSASFIIAPKKQQQDHHSPTPFSKLYNKEKEDDDDERTGMEEAFASLDEIGSFDLGDPVESSELKLNFDLDTDMDLDTLSPEELAKKGDLSTDEIKLYKGMYQEIEQGAGEEVYGDILGELNGEMTEESTSKSAPSSATSINTTTAGKGFGKTSSPPAPLDDADGIGAINIDDEDQLTAVELSQNTDEFMRKALEEALAEAKIQTKGDATTIDESLLNDKELMNEINAVFDRANMKLTSGVEDMKKEQAELTRKSAANRSKGLEEEEQRLKVATGSVSSLVDKVRKETMEVEKAVAELKDAQEKMGDNPLSQAVDLKKAGIVRQSALVGALLFSFRSVGELLAVAQGTGDVEAHGFAAAIQGFIALACGGYLLLF
jgi:hypothetical protein